MVKPFIAAGYRVVVLGLALFFGGAAAWADTIVLKNGRRILAFNVVEAGEKIRYETNAGELSLPKSIVDHIEKGGAVPMGRSRGARWRDRSRVHRKTRRGNARRLACGGN